MNELYAREYARLECERAELNFRQPGQDEALRRLKSVQRRQRRLERDRFVIVVTPTRNGFDVARRFMSSILRRWRSITQGARREKKK